MRPICICPDRRTRRVRGRGHSRRHEMLRRLGQPPYPKRSSGRSAQRSAAVLSEIAPPGVPREPANSGRRRPNYNKRGPDCDVLSTVAAVVDAAAGVDHERDLGHLAEAQRRDRLELAALHDIRRHVPLKAMTVAGGIATAAPSVEVGMPAPDAEAVTAGPAFLVRLRGGMKVELVKIERVHQALRNWSL